MRFPPDATNVVAIAAANKYNLALKDDGTIIGWGLNDYGQATGVANNLFPNVSTGLVMVAGQVLTNVVAISAGLRHSLALMADGNVVGWGANDKGQLDIPSGATDVVAIAAGAVYGQAIKTDGTVVGWGKDGSGMTNTPPSAATNVVAIAGGWTHSLALKADGTVVGWGGDTYGQATPPAEATNVIAIAAGYEHSLAIKANGTLVGWGTNEYGQITIPESLYQLSLPISASGAVDTNILGDYPLSYSVTNSLGAVATTNRTVVMADTLPPVLTLLGGNPMMHEVGTAFVDPGATATDLCAGDQTGSILFSGAVDPNVVGSYSLGYTVTDPSGNLAVTNRTVVVVTRPVLTGSERTESGAFSFTFTNTPGARFSVLASTNLFLPSDQWNVLGSVIENPPGVFQFTDDTATNDPARFYQLRWP